MLAQRDLLDMDPIQQSCRARRNDDKKRYPVARMQTNREDADQQSSIGRVSHPPVKPRLLDPLRLMNRYIRAEGFPQADDGQPAESKSADQDNQRCQPEPMHTRWKICPLHLPVPDPSRNRRKQDNPQHPHRSAVPHIAGAMARAGADADVDFRADPDKVKTGPDNREGHSCSAKESSSR